MNWRCWIKHDWTPWVRDGFFEVRWCRRCATFRERGVAIPLHGPEPEHDGDRAVRRAWEEQA